MNGFGLTHVFRASVICDKAGHSFCLCGSITPTYFTPRSQRHLIVGEFPSEDPQTVRTDEYQSGGDTRHLNDTYPRWEIK